MQSLEIFTRAVNRPQASQPANFQKEQANTVQYLQPSNCLDDFKNALPKKQNSQELGLTADHLMQNNQTSKRHHPCLQNLLQKEKGASLRNSELDLS